MKITLHMNNPKYWHWGIVKSIVRTNDVTYVYFAFFLLIICR